jgi:hypothetical protein
MLGPAAEQMPGRTTVEAIPVILHIFAIVVGIGSETKSGSGRKSRLRQERQVRPA